MMSQKHMAKTVPCPACNRLFTSKAVALEHVENGFCLSAFRARKNSIYAWIYENHPQLTNGEAPGLSPDPWDPEHIVDGGYKCPDCDEVFKLTVGLKDHMESSARKYQLRHLPHMCVLTPVVDGKRRYKCPSTTCDKKFSTAADLWKHFNVYKCSAVASGEEERLWKAIIVAAAAF